MDLSRRRFLLGSAAGSIAVLGLGACRTGAAPSPAAAGTVFRHGVASGDPLADRVILWTRVSPDAAGSRVPVEWEIAEDALFQRPVARGRVETGPERDYTVKVDPTGLAPGTTYHYRFRARGQTSPPGRTRTLPVGSVERVRLAVASCSNLPQGYFNAYRHMAQRDDLDAVLHLGDYLYEYANGVYGDGTALGRVPEPDAEIVSLSDYRTRHAQYKSDPDLQALHAAHPMIAVWDDHESANDSHRDGAENHDPVSQGDWAARRAAAVQAYHEWMPIRALPGEPSRDRTWRSFRFGDLADLVMLDARLAGRDPQAPRGDAATLADPERSLLGAPQEAWFLDQLSRSKEDGVGWRLVGQQVPFASWAAKGAPGHPDKWDGYPESRRRVLDHLENERIDDVVILTGDVHSSWALDVPRDPYAPTYDRASGHGSHAVELITPAISSQALIQHEGVEKIHDSVWTNLPHTHFMDVAERGYLLVDVQPEEVRSEWWFVDTVDERRDGERLGKALRTRRGANHLEPAP